ncbi:MAG: hypothetical protein ACJ8ER_00705 [Allosphingosinicella sp.]
MPSITRRFGTSARGSAIVVLIASAIGMTSSGLQAAPEYPAATAGQTDAARNAFRGCDGEGSGAQRFEVERAGGGTRTIEICNVGGRGDMRATAQALSFALDDAASTPGITSDPRSIDLVIQRLMRARTEVDPTMDAKARTRKLGEIDATIRALEETSSSHPK